MITVPPRLTDDELRAEVARLRKAYYRARCIELAFRSRVALGHWRVTERVLAERMLVESKGPSL